MCSFLNVVSRGLTFTAARSPDGKRQIWEIEGEASFSALDALPLGRPGFVYVATPTGFEPVLPA